MRKKICAYAGCNTLVEPDERYCPLHKYKREYEHIKPFEGATRFNEHLYNTSMWRAIRKKKIAECPYCVKCGIPKEEAILEVHHVIPPRGNEELFFDPGNLIVVCGNCHKIITAGEIRKRK
jgi:5-methylcytosine-specific restriction protein A